MLALDCARIERESCRSHEPNRSFKIACLNHLSSGIRQHPVKVHHHECSRSNTYSIAPHSLLTCLLIFAVGTYTIMCHLALANAAHLDDSLALRSEKTKEQLASDIVAIKEGSDLDLSCPIVVPSDDMIISWTCDDEPANIRSSRIHVTETGKLRIHSAKVGDSCNYRCEAANGLGTLSVVIKVIIVDRRVIDQLTRRASSEQRNLMRSHNLDGPQILLNDQTASPTTQSVEDSPASIDTSIVINPDPNVSSSYGAKPNSAHDVLDVIIQIEPEQLMVKKDSPFSLECRIGYAPHIMRPQIVWLKEFLGPRPASTLSAVMQSDLIFLDGVYYHSLSWPRTVTYSDKSLTASSALLIRHSNYLHSGRYACLAGYPPTLMSLHLNKSNLTTNDGATIDMNDGQSAMATRMSLKYRIAKAIVEVDDPQGEMSYRASLNRREISVDMDSKESQTSYNYSMIKTIRNMDLLIQISCVSLILIIFVVGYTIRRRSSSSTSNASNNDRRDFSHIPDSSSQNVMKRDIIDDDTRCDTVGQNLLRNHQHIISAGQEDFDHIYSEIGLGDNLRSYEEPYYKQPKITVSRGTVDRSL